MLASVNTAIMTNAQPFPKTRCVQGKGEILLRKEKPKINQGVVKLQELFAVGFCGLQCPWLA